MEEMKEKKKLSGGIWKKTWERCKSFSHHGQQSQRIPPSITNSPSHATFDSSPLMLKSKSWSSILHIIPTTPTTLRVGSRSGSGSSKKPCLSTPKGCLSVYVGPDRQKFVIKVECTNHPLFQMLLQEAELEYGFHSNGPLVLPCDVEVFIKVLFDMDADHDDRMNGHWGCSPSPRARTSYHSLNPSTSLVSLF